MAMHPSDYPQRSGASPRASSVDRFSLGQLMFAVTAFCGFLGVAAAGGIGLALHAVVLVVVYLVMKRTWVVCPLFLAVACLVACIDVSGTYYIWRDAPRLVILLTIPMEKEFIFLSAFDGGQFARAFYFNSGAERSSTFIVYWATIGAIAAFSALRTSAEYLVEAGLFPYGDAPIDERRIKADKRRVRGRGQHTSTN